MAASLLHRFKCAVRNLENALGLAFRHRHPDGFCLAGVEIDRLQERKTAQLSLKDIIGDGFLWAVPKHRRSLEKRHKRLYGHLDYVYKLLLPKKNILTCNKCGDDYESGLLCPTCYKKVIEETKQMQEAIQNELKLDPVEKDVVVLYSGEKDEKPQEYWDGKRIVEMNKERPAWFSKNLLQQTTQKPATTKDVKPSDLG